jgi:hypothetical protein
MKLDKEDLKEILEVLTEAESFRPIVKAIIDTLKSYGPEIEELPKKFSQWLVKNRIESINIYEGAGFSREDAITMTLDDVWAFRRMSKNINKSSK